MNYAVTDKDEITKEKTLGNLIEESIQQNNIEDLLVKKLNSLEGSVNFLTRINVYIKKIIYYKRISEI